MKQESSQELWTAVDEFINAQLIPANPALAETRRVNAAAGLPAIDVTPSQGKLLHLLARIQRAQRILEIGTLGGYSTIWLSRALPVNGTLLSLELEPKHAEIARANLARAGLTSTVEIRVGPALDSLAAMQAAGEAPFDFIFIDADKPNNPAYLEAALHLSLPGTLIVIDNVIRDGTVVDPNHSDSRVQGSRRTFEKIAAEPRLSATALQTVSAKGYDGFILAVVTH